MSDRNTHHVLKTLIGALARATGWTEENVASSLRPPPNPELGDYAFPCFEWAKVQKAAPPQAAKALGEKLLLDPAIQERFARVEAAGPFLNFKALPGILNEAVLRRVLDPDAAFGQSDQGKGKTIVIDYSSPNIAKPFHVGHLMSTVLGASLVRIFRFLGYRVEGVNHLGDWGTQCGFQFLAWQQADPKAREEQLARRGLDYLAELYVQINEPGKRMVQLREMLLDKNISTQPEELKKVEAQIAALQPQADELDRKARELFRKLEDGDPELRALWQRMRDKTLEVLQKSYDRLGVSFESDAGEAFYEPHVKKLVAQLRTDGKLVESEGAQVIPLAEEGAKKKRPPFIVIKSDGATKYETRDLAAALYRKQVYDFAKNLYVVDVRQKLHFENLFMALEKLGHACAKDCVHVSYGMMQIKEGGTARPMTTRGGQMIPLGELLDTMVDEIRAIVDQKNPDLDPVVKGQVAEAVGVGAIVFWIQARRRNSNIVFDWKEATNPEGDTGPYLQYTHARFCSILRKFGAKVPLEANLQVLTEPEEVAVCKKLEEFPAVARQAAKDYEPSLLSTWLIELAHAANLFHHKHQVLKAESVELTKARLVLVEAVRRVLASGLGLLGIAAPEEM